MERSLGRYDYENGAYVRLVIFGNLDTEEALNTIELLIGLKRAEIKRKNNRQANGGHARAAALSAARRAEIARDAANARWQKKMTQTN